MSDLIHAAGISVIADFVARLMLLQISLRAATVRRDRDRERKR
jgi:hypothetical protein